MASFEAAFAALGRQFDALTELSPSDKAGLMAGSLTVRPVAPSSVLLARLQPHHGSSTAIAATWRVCSDVMTVSATQVLEEYLARARGEHRSKLESAESAAGAAADEVVQKILGLFAEKIYRKVVDVRDIFLEFDYSGEGTIHAADFAHALARLGVRLECACRSVFACNVC
jgi:hypothetical protein